MLASCGERSVEQTTDERPLKVDSTRAGIVNVSGKLFSIPSPIQTALMIKETNAEYAGELLSDPTNANTHSSNAGRAMNLGVYGADMAYASLYEDGQRALRYFKAIEDLAQELDITGAIDQNLLKRLGANAGRPDSLLLLSGTFYEAADAYLKENERYELAALVLLGGWIESTHLTAQIAQTGNEKAKVRLAEQKQTLNTLKEILGEMPENTIGNSGINKGLQALSKSYEEVTKTYTYVEPETDPDRKITFIKSKTTFEISDSTIVDIARHLDELRKEITR